MKHRCCVCKATTGPDTPGPGISDGYCRRHELEALEGAWLINQKESCELLELRLADSKRAQLRRENP